MISIDSLTKSYGAQVILRGVTFDVGRAEVAVLIGGSGGGKSTVLRCINGLETFQSGCVRVDDITLESHHDARSAAELHHRLRRRVGMVFQQFNLFPHMSVLENVMSGPRFVLSMDALKAAEHSRALLDRVGMLDKCDARPATLSGGQQQRVAIARTLAMQPDVILFDEPTSALDPRMTAEVLAVMADLATSGQTMIVVSHAMGFVRKSAHRVHVLAGGQVIESGPPEQIFDAPGNPQTKEFLRHALN